MSGRRWDAAGRASRCPAGHRRAGAFFFEIKKLGCQGFRAPDAVSVCRRGGAAGRASRCPSSSWRRPPRARRRRCFSRKGFPRVSGLKGFSCLVRRQTRGCRWTGVSVSKQQLEEAAARAAQALFLQKGVFKSFRAQGFQLPWFAGRRGDAAGRASPCPSSSWRRPRRAWSRRGWPAASRCCSATTASSPAPMTRCYSIAAGPGHLGCRVSLPG